jgi:uracil-DNA glycosylase
VQSLQRRVVACRLCPRLVRWREKVARVRVRRFAEEAYWGKPVPGFGDWQARLLVVGLAPAAHGGNRTGRMFTGDASGTWLFRALFRAGFANQPQSSTPGDGLRLTDCYITAALRCAPPQNKPLPAEMLRCSRYLGEELRLLAGVRIVVGLGKIGFESVCKGYRAIGWIQFRAMPHFGHGVVHEFDGLTILGSYHPSQQNTFTGRLTEDMLDAVFADARARLRYRGRRMRKVVPAPGVEDLTKSFPRW